MADIPRRDVDVPFDPALVPRDWCQNQPFVTTHLAALSLLFPEGERFFVDSVKHYRSRITDPVLQEQVAGFIGQEAMHGREHRAFNALFEAQGLRSAPRREAGLRRLLGAVRKVVPARSQLAVTCALEHFTAILAELLLRDPTMRDELHPTVRPLWLWHALEESEHKAVAFDVYNATGGGYAVRASVMAITTIIFFAELAWVHASFARERGLLWKPWTWRGVTRLWLRKGRVRSTLGAYFAYFRPSFHPNDRDTDALLADWRERLFGERGELAAQLRAA